MTGNIVNVGNHQFQVVPDLRGRDRVFIIGTVVDDADGRAIAREVSVASDEPFTIMAQSAREIALVGNPNVAFVDRSIPHAVTVTLRAKAYRGLTEAVTIPAFASLPHRHDFALRHLPITIKGRVFGRTAGPNSTYDPLPGARIALSPVAASGGELPLLLRQRLRARPGAGATIRQRAITAQASLTAIADANAGDAFVAVADGTAVAAGQLLRVGPPQRRFYAEVTQVIAHPDRPAPAALLRLSEGLAGAIPTDTVIERFVVGAFSGSTGNFVGDAYAGESMIWLDVLPASGGVLVVQDGGQPDRYHDAHALTGPAGDYLVEGMARVGEPTFEVSAAGFTTNTRTYQLARLGTDPIDWYLVP